jgi:hypothetical protein
MIASDHHPGTRERWSMSGRAHRFKSHQVEVIGSYSKLSEQGKRLRNLREMRPGPAPEPVLRNPKQAQKRLRPDEIEMLIAAYRAGIPIRELAAHHGVHRATVMQIVERAGEPRRYPALGPGDIQRAAEMYACGMSLAAVGTALAVNANTVRLALLKAGVRMRDAHGRERQ